MTVNPGFQVSLDVMGRLCLVIGGDDEAAEKISRLLEDHWEMGHWMGKWWNAPGTGGNSTCAPAIG